MGKKKRQATRQTISIDQKIYDWVADYADKHGIDFTSAVNHLLADAKEMIIERQKWKNQEQLQVAEQTTEYTSKKEKESNGK